ERSKHAQRTVGADDGRLPDDHGGHLIGSQFGGFEGYENLTPMASEINKYPNGKWGKMEENWAQALRDKKSVKVHIELIYTDDTMRAGTFNVTEVIDGTSRKIKINNPR
ncbi:MULTISPECIES: DNA/RNA non-specific endonuclease, partial [unclassified Pseudomonas]|uniref:DNA/RNA non-specific endonuclease n=1 Tax=unclassified Pseudomonas TaxID=196821 RepID=UPI00244C704F